ncbi:MAG: TonB-dependent receptor plug domain-containing protein, partial [Sulfuricurvum sp.]
DHNGVSESPSLENQALSLMVTHEFSLYDSIELKASHFTSNAFGGPMVSESSAVAEYNANNPEDPAFDGGNVNNPLTSQPMSVLERIDTKRDEIYLKQRHILNSTMNLQTTLAYAEQFQDSLYEGADYRNTDKTYFGDIKIDHALNSNHFLTYGTDAKIETARSQSVTFFADPKNKDDFDYTALGLYAQDAWMIDDKNELTLALRGAKITTDWRAQTAQGHEIDETLLVPRFLWRHNHTNDLTSRLSAGMGYRAPLTFFESEHGLLDNGFGMAITELEKSRGASYALSYDANGLNITASAAYTQVKNLAYINEESGIPTLQNLSQTVSVKNGDIAIGYELMEGLNLSGVYEMYRYDDLYKSHLSLAAIEQRARFSVDYDINGWELYTEATWVGARDLAPYRYTDRYNDLALTSPKNTTAPAYATVDLKISKELEKNFSLYAGAKNLFDTIQTNTESPLFYDTDGGFDSAHIWGPLRGRMVYAGIKATF